ncbi:translation initiation factor IF-2-like [Sorex araneus]|uniref:translation initiation factor IF-2-like n=1 Tax=Sorex araneus TaxID=42254 RepID=UPI0024338292|nr:translation initiation factor IF-2-like [Sorex araneus]
MLRSPLPAAAASHPASHVSLPLFFFFLTSARGGAATARPLTSPRLPRPRPAWGEGRGRLRRERGPARPPPPPARGTGAGRPRGRPAGALGRRLRGRAAPMRPPDPEGTGWGGVGAAARPGDAPFGLSLRPAAPSGKRSEQNGSSSQPVMNLGLPLVWTSRHKTLREANRRPHSLLPIHH